VLCGQEISISSGDRRSPSSSSAVWHSVADAGSVTLTGGVGGWACCRKLNALMEEYTARVGQQAAVIYCTPGKSQHQPHYYKVVGSQPLQNVVRPVLLLLGPVYVGLC